LKTKIAQILIIYMFLTMVIPLNVWAAANSMTFTMDDEYVNGNIYTTVSGVMANQGNYIAWGQYGNVQTSNDGINWSSGRSTWTNNTVANDLYAVEGTLSQIVYNDSEKKYVGIGTNCYASSLDGKMWQLESSSNNRDNNDLLYANGKYYAVNNGNSGSIQQSTDGKNWRTLTTGLLKTTYYNLNAITYGQGKYIVVGSNGLVLSSSDGEIWSNQTLNLGNNYINLTDVIYAGGQYVIVGNYGTILTSSDGETWVKHDSGLTGYSNTLTSISYGNGKYVVVGGSQVLSSTDGVSWSAQSSTSQSGNRYNQVYFGNSGFVATSGRNTVAFSKYGVNWTEKSLKSTLTIDYVDELQFLNNEYVAVGHGFMSSTDGVAWRKKNEAEDIRKICYGNGKYIGIGINSAYRLVVKISTDGVAWQQATTAAIDQHSLLDIISDDFSPADISYGDGKFVLVGSNGEIRYSVDGAIWTQTASGVTDSLTNVIYGNGLYIAAGGSTILYSTDGENWSKANSGLSSTDYFSRISDLTVGNGKVIGVCNSGVILSSLDGINWTKRQSGTNRTLAGISYGNGSFVAIGDAGTILSSTDGATWKAEPRFTSGSLGMITSNGSGFLIGMLPIYNDRLFRSTSSSNAITPSGDWLNGFINEPVNKSWTIHFKQVIDRSTVNSSTVYVTAANGTKLEQSFSYSADGKSLILTPSANYSSGSEYNLNVTTGVKSSTGIPLKANITMHFTVR